MNASSREPRVLDLENVWMLDGRSRSIRKPEVDVRTNKHTDPKDMILRIG